MIEVLKQALEALEAWMFAHPTEVTDLDHKVCVELRQSIADLEKTEPVLAGVANIDDMENWYFLPLMETAKLPAGTKFYTSPKVEQESTYSHKGKCNRIMPDGKLCQFNAPCPDCGMSLIG